LGPFFGFNINYRTTIGNVDFLGCYACMAMLAFMALYVKTEGKVRFLYYFASVMSFLIQLVSQVSQGKVGALGAVILLLPFWVAEKKTLGKFFIMLSGWAFTYWLHHWFLFERYLPSFGEEAPEVRLETIFPSWPLKEMLTLSIIGLVVGLALVYVKQIKWPKLKTIQIASIVIVAVVVVGGLAAVEVAGAQLPAGNIVSQAREVLHGNFGDNFGSGRGMVWRLALGRIPQHAVIGAGPDSFFYAFGEENQLQTRDYVGVVFDKAHNDFIQVVICYGVGGLLAYLALIGGVVLLSVKKAYTDGFLIVALGGALAYIVCSFFGIDTVIVTPIYWLFLAFARGAQLTQPGDTALPPKEIKA
jgi:O-antigen ligase